MTEIEEVKAQIKVLEKKLSFLEELEKTKSPVEEAYKDWWGDYPELETDSQYDDTRWAGFQAGYELAQLKDGCPEPPDEPDYYDEVEWDEKDNPKPMDEVVNRLVEKYQAQKLYNRLGNELDYGYEERDSIVNLVEDWLPKPQSAAGSQNVYVECSVEGFNDCIRKMKSMLR